MAHLRREEITFIGGFLYGVGPADPTMDKDTGDLTPQVAIGIQDDDCVVTAILTEAAAHDFIAKLQAQLAKGSSALIIPGGGVRT